MVTAKKPAPKRAPRKPPEPTGPPVTVAVAKLLASVELDDAGRARAAIATALAAKLDEAALSDSGTIAMATAGIAKELRATLDAILDDTGEAADFVAELFTVPSEVGNP